MVLITLLLMQEIIPTINPTYKQHLAYQGLQDDVTDFLFFGGGAGGGKSWLGCEWLLTNCYFHPGSKWFIAREELKRLMGSSYVTFLKVCQHHQIPREDWKLNGQYNYIEFTNGSRIDLLDAKLLPGDPFYERFGSLEYTGGWIEEGSEVEFMAFDVLKSRVGRHLNKEFGIHPKILITCNPKKGWIYKLAFKPWKTKTLPSNYQFIQSLYSDNPFTADEYGHQLSQITDKNTKERLMKGNWEYDADPATLISYDAILDLWSNTVPSGGEKYLIGDVARFGDDKAVYGFWEGLRCYKIIVLQKKGIDAQQEQVKMWARDERIPYSHILVDEDGVGGGLVDGVKGIKGFVANSVPLENPKTEEKENFANLKAQCSYLLAQKINDHEMAVHIEDEQVKEWLAEELEQIKSKDADKDGKRKIIPKEEVKEIIGRSPDFSDMVMMRMWFELSNIPSGTKQFIPSGSSSYRRHSPNPSKLIQLH